MKKKNIKNILEVGCGVGGGTQILLNFLTGNQDVHINSIDLSPSMIEIAKNNVKDNRVTYCLGNAEHLEFPDQHFDRYFANFVLHLTPRGDVMIS